MSIHAKSIGIALLAIGTINSNTVLVSRDDDEMEPWRRRDAALERVCAVDDWDELEGSGWKTKEAQSASFRRVTARVILHDDFIFGWTHVGLLNSDFS